MSPTAAPPPPDAETRLHSPDLLAALRHALAGRYDVERLIASGGMGSVFLGRDPTLDRPVAIKVIAPELSSSPAQRERFLREARTVARLRHPNIVAVYAAGEAGDLLYFVMEFVDGESLRARLERETRWAGDGAIEALQALARALAYAHAQGIVHRDVKPENILVERETGRVLLTDFGVAQALAPGPEAGRMTGTGMVIGSPYYMSPEQAAGERTLDGRSDIYSLGLVAYEMLSGAPVIAATSSAPTALMKQITERPPALRLKAPTVPPGAAAAIDRALAKDPAERFPDATAFGTALGAAMVPLAAHATARDGRIRALIGGMAVLLVAVIGWWWLATRPDASDAAEARASYLVAPFDVQNGDAQTGWLREGSVSMLSLALSQWRDLSVVDYERSLDLLREAKVAENARVSLEDARSMARRAGVGTVVMGTVTTAADSLRVVARLFDVRTGAKLDDAEIAMAASADPRALFDALATELLNLAGAPTGTSITRLAETTTSSVQAYRDYLGGTQALNSWQLTRADSLFRRAIAADSTFALAYYRLGTTLGWQATSSEEQRRMVASALRFAGRLPPRERAIIEAYAKLTSALTISNGGSDATPQSDSLFRDAQQAYRAVLDRDSTDADAWFGLGDAYYHHRPDGWARPQTVANWTIALRAFERTLTLDSAFYLAYTHKVDLYRWAGGQARGLVLEGDSLRLLDEAAERAYGAAPLETARQQARRRAMDDVRAWTRADPSPTAYLQLALQHSADGRLDSAIATVRTALVRPETRDDKMRFLLAAFLLQSDQVAAASALRSALEQSDVDVMKASGGGDQYEIVLSGGSAAAVNGQLGEMRRAAAIAEGVSDEARTSKGATTRLWLNTAQVAWGLRSRAVLAELEADLAALERADRREAAEQRRIGIFAAVPYLLYLDDDDPAALRRVREWWPADAPPAELEALAALRRGDAATAQRLARTFPDADSLVSTKSSQSLMRWVARARVLTALGDTAGALRWYEQLHPPRFVHNGPIEYAWPLWPRALIAAGDLHAQAGATGAAVAAYERAAALLRDADPALQPLRQRIQRTLAELRGRTPTAELR